MSQQLELAVGDVRRVSEPPAHVYAEAGDRVSLCGAKDPYPHVLARFVSAHVEGWGMAVCANCDAALHLFVEAS